MESPYDANQPIETLIERIRKCCEYADVAKKGYPKSFIMDCFLDRIKECVAYPLDVREWTVKPEEEKSWSNMKIIS